MSIRFGYRAVEERYQPSRLLEFTVLAEKQGFEFICISDHFHPWFHKGYQGAPGCAGHSWIWLGAAGAKTNNVILGTGVTTSVNRYHPAIIAQAFATLGELYPGRIFLGIGAGEAMNEMPMAPAGSKWPPHKVRLAQEVEAIKIIKSLWEKDFVDFNGKYYTLRQANLYTKPKKKIPVYFAAFGPNALRAAGLYGDALMSGGRDAEQVRKMFSIYDEGVRQSGRRPEDMPRMVEMKISYDEDFDKALDSLSMWRPTREELAGTGSGLNIADPRELDRLREGVDPKVLSRDVYTSIDQLIKEIERLIEIGWTDIQVGSNSPDEEKFIEEFGKKALPYLKDKYSK
jgi:coenzyme F420-dependent glucose-6-phosphate dehydrogenase